jgi:hypothetical protein
VLEEDKLATRFQDSSNTPNSFGNAGNRTQRKRANRRIDCAVGQRNAKSETDDAFSNARIYKGPLPSLAIGAIVEEETTVADKLPFFSGGSVYRAYLSRDVPVIRSRVIVETPADTPFQSKVNFLPDAKIQTQLVDGIRRSTYDQDPVPLSPSSDIDLATDNPSIPTSSFQREPLGQRLPRLIRRSLSLRYNPTASRRCFPRALP